jgi:hypothetical protein
MTPDFMGDAFLGDGGLLLATIGPSPGVPGVPESREAWGGCGGAGMVREWERMGA